MYKKILWWLKNKPDKPLSYMLVVAAVFAENADPDEFFNDSYKRSRKEFMLDCRSPNQYNASAAAAAADFYSCTGFYPEDLISSEIWMEIISKDSINDYLSEKTFNSQAEIRQFCKKIYSEYLDEPCFLNEKQIVKAYGTRGAAFSMQMKNLCRSIDAMERWAEGTANQLWFGVNAVRCITKRFETLMNVEQSQEAYNKAVISLMDAFKFSDLQIEMLKYFICQSKEGNCPASLNKAIYFWGKGKGTGKTTIAGIIVSILNGEKDHFNIRNYKSSLAQELQYKDFVAPMICSCRAVLLDEAMPKDSSKSYDALKERITADGCKVRFIHKNQIDLPAKANYVFTSNHPLSYFVQDESERRFLEFHIEKKHKDLSYSELYNMFLRFIQQCKRDREWQEWYDSMMKDTEVRGIESKDIDDIRSFFETSSFLQEIELGSSQVSIGTFYQHVYRFDKNASKQTIRSCISTMFGEPIKPSTWRKSDILAVLKGQPKDPQLSFNNNDCPY